MKRLVGVVLTVAFAGAAMAQSFTIRSPSEGDIVRETVDILIPKGSIPNTETNISSYIGVAVNGKFLEATLPPLDEDGKNYVYKLNTKERGIPDGEMEISIMLYMDFAENTEIVNSSSVKVNLDNHTSIKIDSEGVLLRYQFERGQELVYKHSVMQSAGLVSQVQANLGSRAAQVGARSEEYRYLVAFDNVYDMDGEDEALMRIMGLPDKGKNYTFVTAAGDEQPTKYFDYEMAPIYVRIDDTGREVWGSVPPYFDMMGTSGELNRFNLYVPLSMPVLPTERLFPGESWDAYYLLSALDLEKLYEMKEITESIDARGTFVGVEWERGIPCAKIFMSVTQDTTALEGIENLGMQPGEAVKVEMTGTFWFSLDSGYIVKSEVTQLQESLVTIGTPAGGGGGPAGSGGAGAPGNVGAPGGGAAGFGGGGAEGINFSYNPYLDSNGQLWFFTSPQTPPQGRGGGGPAGAGGAVGLPGGRGGGGAQGPGFGGRSGGGSAGAVKRLLRIRSTVITELEIDEK